MLEQLAKDLVKPGSQKDDKLDLPQEYLELDLQSKITPRWIQRFMGNMNIIGRRQTGKLMVHPAKQAYIDRTAFFILNR